MTTSEQIEQWFKTGVSHGMTHMIVVCDSFEHEDYPAYAVSDDHCLMQYKRYQSLPMQRVMEVYDLRKPIMSQFKSANRCWELPKTAT